MTVVIPSVCDWLREQDEGGGEQNLCMPHGSQIL
jgi:hypothetical protein